jgi:circadian clock protein KaiA
LEHRFSNNVLQNKLSICTFGPSDILAQSLTQFLESDRYALTYFQGTDEFLAFVEREKQQLDCLILQAHPHLKALAHQLHQQSILLPAVIVHLGSHQASESPEAPVSDLNDILLTAVKSPENGEFVSSKVVYHTAESHISVPQLPDIGRSVEKAITQFINFSPVSWESDRSKSTPNSSPDTSTQNFLGPQQRMLAEKLTERLGYLGVYYKRNPKRFLRNLPPAERQHFLDELQAEYRDIVLNYFSSDGSLNQKIDEMVSTAFLADISVTQIVEIHMDLMDDFSKQLKLEGRSEEILLDYRLTLIDIIAHLCEMYRRSIPRDA